MTQNCPLCAPEGEHAVVANDKFRIIRVDDPELPGYFRLIWQDHVKEVSDLGPEDRLIMWDALTQLEEAIIDSMSPEKVNWDIDFTERNRKRKMRDAAKAAKKEISHGA